MSRFEIIITLSILCLPNLSRAQGVSDGKNSGPKIIITSLDISDSKMELSYEIRNDSENEAWIFVGFCQSRKRRIGMTAGLHMAEDRHTLTVQSRYNVTSEVDALTSSYGRFVRLRPGESQTESVFTKVPVQIQPQAEHSKQKEQHLNVGGYATQLAIELGYYPGKLPERIFGLLKPPENVFPKYGYYPTSPGDFSSWNEGLMSRDDELVIPRRFREFNVKSEQVLRAVVKKVRLPYEEKPLREIRYEKSKLVHGSRIELYYKPSVLKYFFPHAFQQSLLSSGELAYLQSEKVFVLEDQADIDAIANDLSRATVRFFTSGGLVERYRSSVDLVCSYDDIHVKSLSIYNDDTIKIDSNLLPCSDGFPSLKIR